MTEIALEKDFYKIKRESIRAIFLMVMFKDMELLSIKQVICTFIKKILRSFCKKYEIGKRKN